MTATAARAFVLEYRTAFSAYVAEPDEAALRNAYELGREALRNELSLLDLATAHHEALLSETRAAKRHADAERVTRLAADFLTESLSAYEMARRGFGEVADAAATERRQGALVRSLSSLLTDTSLALDGRESVEEMARLVAEHACELCDATFCKVVIHGTRGRRPISIAARGTDDVHPGTAGKLYDLSAGATLVRRAGGVARLAGEDVAQVASEEAATRAPNAWLGVQLTALDGTELGFIHLLRESDGAFGELDVALVVQLAEMTSGALERALHYAR